MKKRSLALFLVMAFFVFLAGCENTQVLESIEVTPPTKTIYFVGESFDDAGMVVIAKYNSEDKTLAKTDYVLSGFDSSSPGEKTITVTYEEKTATFKVTVNRELEQLNVTPPTKTNYVVGESIDLTGFVVEAQYKDGHKEILSASAYTLTGFDSTSAGTKTVIVTVSNKTASFEVQVLEPETPPVVTGLVYHWMPQAVEANITATVALGTASEETLKVIYDGVELVEFLDYELNIDTLTIFGAFLHEKDLQVGDHTFMIESEHGETELVVSIVTDPRNTSIETHIIEGVNMTDVAHFQLTEPIANAPELLITEVSSDMAMYSFIEVFNNTTEPYNLKGHRIVYANLAVQGLLSEHELFEQPIGMAGGVYIYQDYVIPALSKATIWVVMASPWTVESTATGEPAARRVVESADVATKIFGSSEENLSIDKFRNLWGMDSSELVFPVRPQYMIHNNTSAYNPTTGLGQPVAKSASSHWTDINTSIDNRGIQIQRVDQETYFPIGEDSVAPANAAFFRYEWVVSNKEEEVYVDGILDRSKIVAHGTSGSSLRESINALGIRKVYFDAEHNDLGYATGASGQVDAYNVNNANYLKMYTDSVTPIVTALVYANLVMEADVITNNKWGSMLTMEYTVPAEGSMLMRFIPRSEQTLYSDYYVETDVLRTLKLSGIAEAISDVLANKEVVVPVSPAYPTNYISSGFNTVGKNGWYNFYTTKPE
jgi:hypothetical protein